MPGTITVYRYRVAGTSNVLTTTAPIPQILSPVPGGCAILAWDARSQSYVPIAGGQPPVACPTGTQMLLFFGVAGSPIHQEGPSHQVGRRIGAPIEATYAPPSPRGHGATYVPPTMGACHACGGGDTVDPTFGVCTECSAIVCDDCGKVHG